MKMKMTVALVLVALVLSLSTNVSASVVTNWDITTSNGTLFCDSSAQFSKQEGDIITESNYDMALKAIEANSHLMHNLSTEQANTNSKTRLTAGNVQDQKRVFFYEAVGMSQINSGENHSVCFSGSSKLTSFTKQIELVSSTTVEEVENIEHTATASGKGNFGLSTASYKLAGANTNYSLESTSSRLKVFNSDFKIRTHFHDPIDDELKQLLSFPNSDLYRSLCPFYKP